MGLKEQIRGDMKKAAKERNSLALSALRMTLAAIKNKEIEARGEIGEDLVRNVLATMVKQRREAKAPADMGRVMKELMPKVAGRADGKTVNEIVRRLLAG